MLLTGCEKTPVNRTGTNNPEVLVDTLFTHEGCTVYRFTDSGHFHYYTKCNTGTSETLSTQSCGKNCTQQESIQSHTYRKN